jgi:hypothetical protein
LQVFEGVQRVVVDEDADGALRRQQVSQPIDQAGEGMVYRIGFGRRVAVTHRGLLIA